MLKIYDLFGLATNTFQRPLSVLNADNISVVLAVDHVLIIVFVGCIANSR